MQWQLQIGWIWLALKFINNIPNKFDSDGIHTNQWIGSGVPPMRCERREFVHFIDTGVCGSIVAAARGRKSTARCERDNTGVTTWSVSYQTKR
jgi:hypothetical protein